MSSPIKTRFAPSPTGYLHIGSARTALFNYIFARQNKGEFVLRIEDTDRERSTKEFEDDIKEGLTWLGLEWDFTHTQQDEMEYHKSILQELIDKGHAYVSKEEVKKKGDRDEVIRFKNPGTPITFTDLVRGDITMETESLGDFVIAKDMETPLYHLAVVADDAHHKVTHIIRGEDGISNTPRQILIQHALGYPTPIYAHLPLILAPDKTKLSKRHGAVSIVEYRKMGYLKDTLLNYLILLGWHPKDDNEILSLDDMIRLFRLEDVQKGGAVFDIEKLNWLNRYYIHKQSDEEFVEYIKPYTPAELLQHPQKEHILEIIKERIDTAKDVEDFIQEGEWVYFYKRPVLDPNLIGGSKKKPDAETTKKHLSVLCDLLDKVPSFNYEDVKDAVWEYAEKEGRGEVLWPMRYALSGKERSPDPFLLATILGKEETCLRLKTAQDEL